MEKKNKKLGNVHFVRLRYKQNYIWHAVLVKTEKVPIFQKLSSSQQIDVKDYGEILESGWGIDAPDDVKEKYGFN